MNTKLRRTGFLLSAPLAIILLTAAAMLILWGLLSQGITEIITPSADNVAEQFGAAVGARRYKGALNQMTSEQKQQVSKEELKALVDQIEQQHQGMDDVKAQGSQEQGDSATVDLQVQYEDGSQKTVQVPLKRENHLWKVSSIEPVNTMAQ